MYSGGFNVSVIINGKITESSKQGVVAVPFDTEYSLRISNKLHKKAVAKIYIDDENVSQGGLVINGKSTVELDCRMDNHRKFKFVSIESGQAVDAGKSNNKDGRNGVIRIEFEVEREHRRIRQTIHPIPYNMWPEPPSSPLPPYINPHQYNPICNLSEAEEKTSGPLLRGAEACKNLTDGCTVSGNVSNQIFHNVHVDIDHSIPPVIITLVLKGYTQAEYITNKKYCTNCGHECDKHDRYCGKCGNKVK